MNNTLIRNLTLATTLLSGAAMAAPLTVTVYNPGERQSSRSPPPW